MSIWATQIGLVAFLILHFFQGWGVTRQKAELGGMGSECGLGT